MASPASSAEQAQNLRNKLLQHGLGHCEDVLLRNGFDDWETVTAIMESDMVEMGIMLGDRRKLQRAIATSTTTSNATSITIERTSTSTSEQPTSARPKRRYRRQPQVDPNAPIRPKTAYVQFGEHIRNEPALNGFSFADLAKETGRRWQAISTTERAMLWEDPASKKLEQYRADLEAYEETQEYRDHQAYLLKFYKAQAKPAEPESSTSASRTSEAVENEDADILSNMFGEPEEVFSTETSDPSMLGFEAPQDSEIPPFQAGMEEVDRIFKGLGVGTRFSRFKPFPPEMYTSAAVQAFLHNTGSLLYLWTQDDGEKLLQSVYQSDRGPATVEATELFAMAAIGSYCDGDTMFTTYQQSFMDSFISLLQSRRDIDYLRGMRLFTCLAICRFTNSVASARKLMLSALRIGREIFMSPDFEQDKPPHSAPYWWSIFRSVIFLESWFAYNTGFESRVVEQDLTLYNPPAQTNYYVGTIHERVGDLGGLATYIAIDLKDTSRPKLGQAKSYLNTLDQWHRTLPPPMQLSRLNLADPLAETGHTKRALLQLHILFLGLFIEPFRACLVDVGNIRLGRRIASPEDMEIMEFVETQSILAARQSARVASLLQSNQLVRAHCWVAIFASFTACAILLFSASQRMLTYNSEDVSHELLYASSHLNLLSLCSYNSGTAKTLYAQLQVIFNEMREVLVSPAYSSLTERHRGTSPGTTTRGKRPKFEGDDQGGETVIMLQIQDLIQRILAVLQQRLSF